MLGIEDTYVWLAYLLCLLSMLLCIGYGLANWNRGDESVEPADIHWATENEKTKEDL